MKIYDVLIVEDDYNLAQLHAEHISNHRNFNPVGITHTVKEALNMIRVFNPDLILLDNYLPDGNGINILKEIINKEKIPDVIFITAARDMIVAREVIRCGVFDYLVKPISYQRLDKSLNRFLNLKGTILSTDQVNQRYIDQIYNINMRKSHTDRHPKGISSDTLEKIMNAFKDNEIYTSDSLSDIVGVSKTTARRYLEYCASMNYLDAETVHGRVGRPERIYKSKTMKSF